MYDNGEQIRYELAQLRKQVTVLMVMTALSLFFGMANIIMLLWAIQQ